MEVKRVMHIAQSAGGVERYISMLLRNTDISKLNNIMVCSYDYNKKDYSNLVNDFEYVDMCREINLKKDFNAVIKVRKLIKKYKPDVVYMHSSKAGAIGRIANIGIENVSLYNPHGWAFNMQCGSLKKSMYKYIEKILSKLCTKIITISEFEKKSAIYEKICSEDKLKVIFNGVDIDEFVKESKNYNVTKASLGIPRNAYVFGMVGRLTKQKAPDVFIEFASLIKKEIPNSFFIFVGDGEEKEEIQNIIRQKGLSDSILITGWVKNPMEYIKIFDQALLLSRWEGFGLVLTEYMLAEKPIIATNVNAIPDLIENGINGVLVPIDDPRSVLNAAINIYKDKEFKNYIVKNGVNIVNDRFNIKRVVMETEDLIRGEIIEGYI